MKRLLMTITVAMISWLTIVIPVWCQDQQSLQVVEVWGESPVYHGNKAGAKDRALQEAFSAAVTKVIGAYITAESFSQNFVSIDRTVLTRSEGYVKSYDILEVREEPDYLSLHVRATVSTKPIKDDLTALGILLDAMGNPVFFVYGHDEGLKEPRSVSTFKTALSEKGFQVIGGKRQSQANILMRLTGSITSQQIDSSTDIYGVVVDLKVIVGVRSTGVLIVEKSIQCNAAGVTLDAALNEAYTDAASQLVDQVVDIIAAKWARQMTAGRMIQLTLASGDYQSTQRFQQDLTQLFGVRKVELQSYRNGKARYGVRFTGNAKTLVNLILKHPPANLPIFLESLEANAISMRIK